MLLKNKKCCLSVLNKRAFIVSQSASRKFISHHPSLLLKISTANEIESIMVITIALLRPSFCYFKSTRSIIVTFWIKAFLTAFRCHLYFCKLIQFFPLFKSITALRVSIVSLCYKYYNKFEYFLESHSFFFIGTVNDYVPRSDR